MRKLQNLSSSAASATYTRENIGALAIRLMEFAGTPMRANRLHFPADSLSGRKLLRATFEKCRFGPTSIASTVLSGSRFAECNFALIELSEGKIGPFVLEDCHIEAVYGPEVDDRCYDPGRIPVVLRRVGIQVKVSEPVPEKEDVESDPLIEIADRALRAFTRSTHISENTFRLKFGARSNLFFEQIMPRLIQAGIVDEIQHRGAGRQRRFKLAVPMRKVEEAVRKDFGVFDEFLSQFKATA